MWLLTSETCQDLQLPYGSHVSKYETLFDVYAVQVDASIITVAKTYALECGGLPFTVCEYLDTASISDAAAKQHVGNSLEGCDGMSDSGSDVSSLEPHPMAGHKFELRIVVYRDGDVLKAYPAIAKVGVPDEVMISLVTGVVKRGSVFHSVAACICFVYEDVEYSNQRVRPCHGVCRLHVRHSTQRTHIRRHSSTTSRRE